MKNKEKREREREREKEKEDYIISFYKQLKEFSNNNN